MKTSIQKATLLGATSLAVLALPCGTAHAQDAASQQVSQGDESNVIIVTGSRIAAPPGFDNPNPVVSITSDTIEQSGQTNITEFLANSPALLGSQRSIDSAGSNLTDGQSVGVNFLNLRNLGTSRTLVLVDGRRHVAGYPGDAAVDINTIPTDLIERVDVLTGGVGAIYGADGVSGVVNFIMKKDFDGLRLRAQNTISQRGDAGERFAAATFGKNFANGRGNLTVAYEFNETDRFSQTKRLNYGLTGPTYAFVRNPNDGSPGSPSDDPNVPDRILLTNLRWADSAVGGAIDVNFDGVPDYTGEGKPYDLGTYVPGTPYTIGGDSTPINSYFGDFTPYTRKHIANLMGHFEVSPALNIYAEAKYVKSTAYTFYQPTYDFYTVLSPDNYYLNQQFGANAPDGALVSRDNFDFGVRRAELNRELWRTVLGANGELSPHLRYDASFVFGQSTQRSTSSSDRILDRYSAALDAVDDGTGHATCRINLPGETTINGFSYGSPYYSGPPLTFTPGECVPLNILGNGSPSPEALAWVLATHTDYARIRQYVGNVSLSGDTGAFFNLPGGPVGFAVGAEYRKETSNHVPSYYSLNGFLDSAQQTIDTGEFDVKEAFAEVRLPLLADQPFAKELSLGAALRVSDYSTVGTTTTWNVNGTYSPIRDIAFRGTYSVSVRAPNISELFAGSSGTYEFINDPCGPERIAEGTSTRAANCAAALSALNVNQATFDPANDATSPANSSLLGSQGGNPNLAAEKAKTWTAGVVLRPTFVPNLIVSADWYSINLSKAINYSTAQDIVDLCYDQPTLNNQYCALISRSSTTGYINDFSVIPQNVASYKTAGLDVSLAYSITPSPTIGNFNIRLVGNYLDKLEIVPSLGAIPKNQVDNGTSGLAYPAPRLSGTFDLTWTKGAFTLNYGINWTDKTRRVTREQEAANPDYLPQQYIWYKQKWEHKLYMAVDIDKGFTLYGGVDNLFDTKPDVGAVAYPISAVGRSFYMGVKAKLF